MSSDVAFAIRLELAAPIIPGRRFMLDALLSGLLFERLGDAARAVAEIPLSRHGQTWCGSQALLEGPCEAVPVVYTMALRPERDLAPDNIRPTGRGGRFPSVETTRGPYQNRMSTMVSYEAAAVWFCGKGDLEAVRSLLEDVPAIGKKRSSGFGAIRPDSLDIEETSLALAGLVFADGTPARAVPVETWKAIGGGSDAELASEAAVPPYWQGVRETCAVPSHLIVDRAQAGRLAGLD